MTFDKSYLIASLDYVHAEHMNIHRRHNYVSTWFVIFSFFFFLIRKERQQGGKEKNKWLHHKTQLLYCRGSTRLFTQYINSVDDDKNINNDLFMFSWMHYDNLVFRLRHKFIYVFNLKKLMNILWKHQKSKNMKNATHVDPRSTDSFLFMQENNK